MTDRPIRPLHLWRTAAMAIVVGAALSVGGCSDEPERHDVEDGVACGFLPQEALEAAIGTGLDGLDVRGVSDDRDADCTVSTVDGTELVEVNSDVAPPG